MMMPMWFDGSNGRTKTRSMPAAPIADAAIAAMMASTGDRPRSLMNV